MRNTYVDKDRSMAAGIGG